MYDVSIIIPTYNRGILLEMTLKTIAAQELHGISLETIIVDDGSTDNTIELVEKYANKMDNVKYIYNEHQGFRVAYVRNIGIRNATGNIIIFVDSEMILCKQYVYQHYLSHIRNCKNDVAVIGRILAYGDYAKKNEKSFYKLIDLSDLDKTFQAIEEKNIYEDLRMDSFKSHSYNIGTAIAPYAYFWTGNVSVKLKCLFALGGFDENFSSWGMEDIELGYRLFKKGVKFILNLDAKSIHAPHDMDGSIMCEVNKERDKQGKLYFYKKYRNIETEMYVTGCSSPFYNDELSYLFQNSVKRFNFENLEVERIIDAAFNENSVIIGGFNGSITKFIKNATLLEYDEFYYLSLKDMYDRGKVYNSIGTLTLFRDNQFDFCLITDFWFYLNNSMLFYLLKESKRIAKEGFLLYQININGISQLSDNMENINRLFDYLNNLSINYKYYKYCDIQTELLYIKF